MKKMIGKDLMKSSGKYFLIIFLVINQVFPEAQEDLNIANFRIESSLQVDMEGQEDMEILRKSLLP